MLFSEKIPFQTAARLTARYWVPKSQSFVAPPPICYCSLLFILFPTRYSGFPDTLIGLPIRCSKFFRTLHCGCPQNQKVAPAISARSFNIFFYKKLLITLPKTLLSLFLDSWTFNSLLKRVATFFRTLFYTTIKIMNFEFAKRSYNNTIFHGHP